MAVAAKRPHDPPRQHVEVVVVGDHGGAGADAEPGGVGGEHAGRGDRDRNRAVAIGEVAAPVGEHGAGHVALAVAVGVGAVAGLARWPPRRARRAAAPGRAVLASQSALTRTSLTREWYKPPVGVSDRYWGPIEPAEAAAVAGRPVEIVRQHLRWLFAVAVCRWDGGERRGQAPAADGPLARAAAVAAPADQPPGRRRRARRASPRGGRAGRPLVRADRRCRG